MGASAVPFLNESSAQDVYDNKVGAVDTDLVKDWTSNLNFLLVFVSISVNPVQDTAYDV